MRGLRDKVFVVCAGGTGDRQWIGPGIGAAIARRLAAEGAKVVIGDLDEAAAHRTADRIRADGASAVGQHYDAGDEDSTRRLMERAIAEHGAIDGIHFNAMDITAGDIDGQHDLVTLPLDVWRRRLDVGLLGLVFAARYAVPHLLARVAAASSRRRPTRPTWVSRSASPTPRRRPAWARCYATSRRDGVARASGRTGCPPVSCRAR